MTSQYEKMKAITQIVSQIPDDVPWDLVQYALICARLDKFNGSRTKACKSLGISLRNIRYKIILMRDLEFLPKDPEIVKKVKRRKLPRAESKKGANLGNV